MPLLQSTYTLEDRKANYKYKLWIDELFKKYDQDNSGLLDKRELGDHLLDENGRPLDKMVFDWIWAIADQDESGQLSRGELYVLMKTYQKYKEHHGKLISLIKTYDSDRNMKLDEGELRSIVRAAVGREINRAEVLEVIQEYRHTAKCSGESDGGISWPDNSVPANAQTLTMALCTWSVKSQNRMVVRESVICQLFRMSLKSSWQNSGARRTVKYDSTGQALDDDLPPNEVRFSVPCYSNLSYCLKKWFDSAFAGPRMLEGVVANQHFPRVLQVWQENFQLISRCYKYQSRDILPTRWLAQTTSLTDAWRANHQLARKFDIIFSTIFSSYGHILGYAKWLSVSSGFYPGFS